ALIYFSECTRRDRRRSLDVQSLYAAARLDERTRCRALFYFFVWRPAHHFLRALEMDAARNATVAFGLLNILGCHAARRYFARKPYLWRTDSDLCCERDRRSHISILCRNDHRRTANDRTII